MKLPAGFEFYLVAIRTISIELKQLRRLTRYEIVLDNLITQQDVVFILVGIAARRPAGAARWRQTASADADVVRLGNDAVFDVTEAFDLDPDTLAGCQVARRREG